MRTNIVIDDDLIREAQNLTGLKTKRETVDYAHDPEPTGCLIAAPCIPAGATLLHRDADFDRLASYSELKVLSLE